MTTPVCVRQRIRQLDRQGLSHKEISRKLGVSCTTVAKYANHGDYSPRPSNDARPGRSLVDDGYAAIVDGWPAADLRMPVKQSHIATRVYERLVAECGSVRPPRTSCRGFPVEYRRESARTTYSNSSTRDSAAHIPGFPVRQRVDARICAHTVHHRQRMIDPSLP